MCNHWLRPYTYSSIHLHVKERYCLLYQHDFDYHSESSLPIIIHNLEKVELTIKYKFGQIDSAWPDLIWSGIRIQSQDDSLFPVCLANPFEDLGNSRCLTYSNATIPGPRYRTMAIRRVCAWVCVCVCVCVYVCVCVRERIARRRWKGKVQKDYVGTSNSISGLSL